MNVRLARFAPSILSTSTWRQALPLASLALIGALTLAPAAAAQRSPLAAGPGVEAVGPDGSPAERLALGPGLLTRLLAVPLDEEARLESWPVAPGVRADVVLARHDVYDPQARIWKVEGSRQTELPRSDLAFYWGTAEGDDSVRVFLTLDPKGRLVHSFAQSSAGVYELRPTDEGGGGPAGQYLMASAEAFAAAEGIGSGDGAPTWRCGEENDPLDHLLPPGSSAAPSAGGFGAKAFASLHTATIAVDTDNELLLDKFSNNTLATTDYIASLFAAMNVMYERDLKVRLLQGTTFLRISTVPDPFVQLPTQIFCGASVCGDSANVSQLNEVASYWSSNHAAIPRALTMMLSGRSQFGNSSSGIAFINVLCSGGSGYSFTQVFTIDYLPGDALVVGHEIGHNFGSPHSHCYSPPIDNCYNSESGCYSGTRTCPASTTINGVTGVTGSVMSYCHVSGLANCNSSLVFHSRTVQLFDTILPSKACVVPFSGAALLSSILPATGPTAGGTPITILGSSFQAGATVSIGGSPATSVVVQSSTRITAVTPAHAAGKVSVVVTNPGTGGGTLANSFFYTAPPSPASFFTITPCRIIDTRNASGPYGGPAFGPSAQRTFDFTGPCGIPSSAKAVVANLTVVAPPVLGLFSTFPGDALPLGTSTLSFKAGITRSNNATLTLATDGSGLVGIQNLSTGSVHLVVDVSGYYQ